MIMKEAGEKGDSGRIAKKTGPMSRWQDRNSTLL